LQLIICVLVDEVAYHRLFAFSDKSLAADLASETSNLKKVLFEHLTVAKMGFFLRSLAFGASLL
jgi:hypothetical protein